MTNYIYDQTYDEYSLWDYYGPMPWDTITTLQYPDAEQELRRRNMREYGGTAPMYKRTIRRMSTDYELIPEPVDVDTWEAEGGA
jgi:hypothetical protein